MTNDKMEFLEQRLNATDEDVKELQKDFKANNLLVDTKMTGISKEVTEVRLVLAKWMGIALVLGVVLQALTVAIITSYFRTVVTHERVSAEIGKK